MPVRFVFKSNNTTYFVADMTPEVTKETFSLEDIQVKRYPSGILLSYSSHNMMTDYIRTHPDLLRHSKKKPLNIHHLITHFTKNIRQFVVDEQLEDLNEDILLNRYFISAGDNLFQVFNQYRILTIADYASYGPYEDIIFEYMQTHEMTSNIYEHVKTMMYHLERLFPYTFERFVIINNKNTDVIFNEDIL
jgi:hypothetical protein